MKSPLVKLIVIPLAAVAVANLAWFVASAFIEAGQKTVGADGDVPIVYRGARIHTASGPVIERGVMIVVKGKILDVGAEDKVKIPAGAKVRDMTGKVIIPGLVDTHSHIGIFGRNPGGGDGNEMTGPVQPGLRALDAINPARSRHPHGPGRRRHHRQHHARLRQRHRRADPLCPPQRHRRRGHAHHDRPSPRRHQVRQRRKSQGRLRQQEARPPARA